MSLYVGNKNAVLVKGDFHPAELYKGKTKIAGYESLSKTGKILDFRNTYNDFAAFSLYGLTHQKGTPTPAVPVPLTSAENPTVESSSKNILTYPYYHSTKTTNGITFTDNGDGSVTVNGTATDTATFWFRLVNGWTLPPGEYTFSCKNAKEGITVIFGDVNSDFPYTSSVPPKTINIEAHQKRLGFFSIRVAGGTVCDNITLYPQLEVGPSPSPYSPYQGTGVFINATLRGIEVTETQEHNLEWTDESGTVRYAVADTYENGVITRRIGEMVFNGTENWWQETQTHKRFLVAKCFPAPDAFLWGGSKNGPAQLCSHFARGIPGYQDTDCFSFDNGGSFCLQYEALSDIAALRQWLAENPVAVQYLLAQPVTEEASGPELRSFKGHTVITTTGGIIKARVNFYRDALQESNLTADTMPGLSFNTKGDKP